MRVTTSLINIKAITAHFSPKIDAWLSQQQLSTPSQEQILEVVKANYDSLTLKLQVYTKLKLNVAVIGGRGGGLGGVHTPLTTKIARPLLSHI